MSNSFPSMISNEPPPLDQSDEDDEDSEDFRDFATGLKLDVDPSPMSTPRKGGNSTPPSVPVRTENSTPETCQNGSLEENSGRKTVIDAIESLEPPVDTHPRINSTPTPLLSGLMKTSYIGTMEADPEPLDPEPVESETLGSEAPVSIEVDSFTNFARSEVVSQPTGSSESQIHTSTDSNQSLTDEDDFDDFQDFQTNTPVVDPVDELNVVSETPENREAIEVAKPELGESIEGTVQENTEPCSTVELQYEDASSLEPALDPIPTTTSASDGEIFEDAEPLPSVPSVQVPATPEDTEDTKATFQPDFAAFQEEDDEFDNFQDFKSSGFQQSLEPVRNDAENGESSQTNKDAAQISTILNDGIGSSGTNFVTEEKISSSSEASAAPTAPIILSMPDLPMENSSSSNFNSFSDDDDFDDFQAFQSTPSSLPSSSKVEPVVSSVDTVDYSVDFSVGTTKFESLVKSLFVPSSSESSTANLAFTPIDKQLKEQDGNEQWNQVEDFEASQGLLFKWLNSVAYQRFLKSLKIDNSTIVYTDKWGAIEVPRFAASLVDSPLQPETGCKSSSNGMPLSKEVSPVRYVGAEQSYSDQESTNGVVMSSSSVLATGGKANITVNGGQLSREAEQILNQLPDLSFMRAKNLVFPNKTATHVISSDV